ncbi:hypothetical protein QQZ08_001526 [Neonectria magnoliae]|uniref:Uncharacterized protein n=1 Tax=Neonectria magnoliae TaxID=2732573 RepID=A0ABR1IE49_9HYPO
MGLPLFIAPIESDLPSKATDKNRATSPSRSGIRRHVRPDSRERRVATRRHMSIRDRMAMGSLRQSRLLSGRDGRDDAGVRIIEPLHMEDLRRPRPFREVLRDMARTDDRSRERFEEQLHSLFNGNGHPEGEATDNDIDLGWWAGDPIPQSTRTRITAPGARSEDTWEARIRNEDSWERRWEPRREYSHTRHRISPLVQQPTPPRALTEDASNRRQRTTVRDSAPMSELDGGQGPRNAILRHIRGMDGLGDRDRSLSPEVWDTLLTTLTPDPQPPSAGSSFASNVASQNAGVSSSTSLSIPQSAEAVALDQACESGCENSDTEGADNDQADVGRPHQRWDHLRRVRVRVPDYNLDGSIDGPADGPFSRSGASNSERLTARQRRLQREALEPPDIIVGGPGDIMPSSSSLNPAQLYGPRNPGLGPRWIGHMSVGASDDEHGTERRSLNRESSTASGNNASPGDEEWAGMQRIVRSLARREDIPDEWWAEAGLSRTLPPDGTD